MRIAIFINTSWNIYNFRSGLIRSLRNAGYEVHALAPEDKYSVYLTAMGCVYHPISMNNTGNDPLRDAGLIKQVFHIYRKIQPSVVLHYTIKPNIYGSLVSRYLGIPTICTVSGLGTIFLTDSFTSRVATFLYKKAFRYPQRIFFQNQSDLELFNKKKLLKSSNYQVLQGSGIDLRKFAKSDSTPIAPPFNFLMIARLIEEKGILEYLEAARILASEQLPVRCQILGSQAPGHIRGISLEQISDYPVEYLGETEDVRSHIERAHAVVLPSYREGLSKSLLEAAAMEKPAIASDVPGCREVVKDQINGLLCKPRDPVDLAAKMRLLQSYNMTKLEQMGSAGRSLVSEHFTEDRINKVYLKTIKDLTNSNRV